MNPLRSGHNSLAPSVIRVLVADDHAIVREGLSAMISRQTDMQVVAEAANGSEAYSLWCEHRPDVSLLDLRMPVLDGVAAIRAIRAHSPQARLIIVTTFDTDADVCNAIRAGAKGYLLKDAGKEELLECIRRVYGGATWIPPHLVAKLAQSLNQEALTTREMQVLRLLACGNCNKAIALELFISEPTVKSHLSRIFGKLGVISRAEAIAVACHQGLIQL